jgi:thiol-disulfide isomerase/thioredoxin
MRSDQLRMLVALMVGVAAMTMAGCQDASPPPSNTGGPQATSPRSTPAPPSTSETPSATSTEVAAAPAAASTEPPPAKKPRNPIYIEEANGEQLIAAALERAKAGGKNVLIEWGGNWCGWCYKLHDVFHDDADVHPIVEKSFELVLIDSNTNSELMQTYGGKDRQFSYPHLTVLDPNGKVLTNQETGSLEEGPRHHPAKVAEFLKTWVP